MMKFDGLTRFMRFKLRRRAAAAALPSPPPDAKQVLQNQDPSRLFDTVQTLIRKILLANATLSSDLAVSQFSKEYYNLDFINKRRTLNLLATEYGVDRANIQRLARQYLGLQPGESDKEAKQEENFPALYRTEQSLRSALMPTSAQIFKQINCQPGGLKFLVDLRADLRSIIEDREQNLPSFRTLDACLKEMLETSLSPAGLELHKFTWDDSASILEKIVAFEAVHPISNLYDLRRRLGSGRRCFGYFHPSMPGEPLIFIEVALAKSILGSIQDVLWNETPPPEDEATTAVFYSISSTQLPDAQPGLAGISLGKLLIKRVVSLLQQEMPNIETFATLSPIPGFMAWLLPKLASQAHSGPPCTPQGGDGEHTSIFKEDILHSWEKTSLLESCGDTTQDAKDAAVILWNILTSPGHEWTRSEPLQKIIKPILLRLCARYLMKERRRRKALDAVANFHVQNGASIERLNWMGDYSEQGLIQSAGIMVNYVYRLHKIEENIEQYLEKGVISASSAVQDMLIFKNQGH